MSGQLQFKNRGKELRGELHSTNASGGVEVPIFCQTTGEQVHIAEREQIEVIYASLVTAAGGDSYLYEDLAGIEVAVAAADATANTFTIAGDATRSLPVDATFYVYASTGNDGEYTVTASSYDTTTNETTITVASVTDGTDDGTLAWRYYAIAAADATANTFVVAGDARAVFPVGRLFIVDGSTGNDASGADYTVTATSYDANTNQTTITVASVVDNTDDGFIVPQATVIDGKHYFRGTYAANGGKANTQFPQSRLLEAGHTLYGLAPSGVSNFEMYGWLRRNLTQSAPVGNSGRVS